MSGKTDKHRIHDDRVRRDRAAQERARAEMNDLVKKVDSLAPDAVDEVTARVAQRKAAAKETGDPMLLQASGRKRRAEAARREDLQRRHLAFLLGKGTINSEQLKAAAWLHDLMVVSTGGMKAMDWTRERVDGGKLPDGPFGGGALDAERKLRSAFVRAGLSFDQQEIVLRVVGFEESLTSVAISFETKPEARNNGACSRETQGHVKRLLADALTAIYNLEFATNRMDERPGRAMLRAWLATDAIPSDRPDLRGVGTAVKASA